MKGAEHTSEKAGALVWVGPLLFFFAIAATTIALWTDREWLEMAVDQQLRSMSGDGTEEGAEISRRAIETAIDTGAMGYLLAMRALWVVGRSHLLFLLLLLFILGRTGCGLGSLRTFAVRVSQSYIIPAVGILLNALLRWHCVRMNGTFSAAFFIQSYDGRMFWHQLSAQADLFVLLFFVRLAFLASHICGGKPVHFIGLIMGLWFIINSASNLFDFVFELAA